MWISEELKLIDNIIYFRHIKYPRIVIKNPEYIICIKSNISGNRYIYGSFVAPDKDMIEKYVQDYMYANEEFEMFNFDITKFEITIKNRKHEN